MITLTKAASNSTPIVFQFLDGDGAIVGSDSFFYSRPNNNGTLEWVGWQFSSPVRQILYGGTFIVNDSLQFNLIPESSVSSILLATAVSGVFLRRRACAVSTPSVG